MLSRRTVNKAPNFIRLVGQTASKFNASPLGKTLSYFDVVPFGRTLSTVSKNVEKYAPHVADTLEKGLAAYDAAKDVYKSAQNLTSSAPPANSSMRVSDRRMMPSVVNPVKFDI